MESAVFYRNLRNPLDKIVRGDEITTDQIRRLLKEARVLAGSTDMGDVSHVVPSIHPYLAIVDEKETA